MNTSKRERRVKKLVKMLNKERKRQGKKIDILCNDFVEAQRNFIRRLGNIAFAADFYEGIIGRTELRGLLERSGDIIRDKIPDSQIVTFLKGRERVECQSFEKSEQGSGGGKDFLDCFTAEVIEDINKANKVCREEELLKLGLGVNPAILDNLSAVTLPLYRGGQTLGFVLIYRLSGEEISSEQIDNVSAVTSGLSKAIQSCKAHLNSTK